MNYNIYTYDKATERKTGAFTMFVFAICLLLFPLFIMVFDGLRVSLVAHFLKNADVPVYAGLETESMGAMITFMIVTLVISSPIIFTYIYEINRSRSTGYRIMMVLSLAAELLIFVLIGLQFVGQ